MTDIISTTIETSSTKTEVAAETIPCEASPAYDGISLKTALRILDTIAKNANEAVAFWASKTAYSGVYRTAVKNGWIVDGLFVTDIPEGVDGGFLAADMRRIALMAKLLADVLSDQLVEEQPLSLSQDFAEAVENALIEMRAIKDEIDALKDEIETIKADAIDEIEDLLDEITTDR